MPLQKQQSNQPQGKDSGEFPRYPNDSNTLHPFQLPPQKEKKRNFLRFVKKKSRPDMASAIASAPTNIFNIPSAIDSGSTLGFRKRSREYEQSAFGLYTEGGVNDAVKNGIERKKSLGGSSSRKGNDREKSEGSIYFITGEEQNGKGLELDQDFESMEGIINQDYLNKKPPSIMTQQGTNPTTETWLPPDSWAVQPADDDEGAYTPVISKGFPTDYFPVVEYEALDIPSKNFCIRIFRPDGTFGTLIVPLETTTHDLIQRLAEKFFLHDLSKYRVTVTRQNLGRVLQVSERPAQIQKTLLEQMGYTEEDKIEDVGREDNSYLFRFSFGPSIPQVVQEEEEFPTYRRVDLQAKNLSTVPIFLYKYASRINSLDLSKNLLLEAPVDFLQMCKSLKQLWLTNNDYVLIPSSLQYIPNLEHLNISSNHIRDLEPAHLENINSLRTLRAYNNQLKQLPQSFSKFQHLTILFISNNSFTKFPDVICQIKSLAYLDISFNKISTFPEEICNLSNLIGLFATANRLTGSLPPSFAKLEKLQELDVRQNQITDLDVISRLSKLEVILVDYNAVSVVNYDFKNLRQLRMSKNHLTHFSLGSYPTVKSALGKGPTIAAESMLTELNISNCKLASLPKDLFEHTSVLETLTLDCNTLSELPSSIGVLTKLVRLSVQANNLEALPSEISNLVELKVLDVQKNNMKTLPKEIWRCVSLQTLNCSSNLLDVFPEPFSEIQENTNQMVPQRTDSLADMEKAKAHTGLDAANIDKNDSPESTLSNSDRVDSIDNIPANLLSSGFLPPPNFNPPSFFASPRNHPPPLSLSLRNLFLGDNRFTDDVWSPLSLFLELRTLNLSFNDLYEIPPEGLCHQHLYELYLSGNQLTSLPADDLEKLCYLRVLAVNGNKLQTLPAEIGKLRKLLVLDVGNNVLKYNISNWPYDWNWNWNLGLKYLNLSGNKRLEIKKTHPEMSNPKDKNLSDFSALTKLRMLGLMDVTILGVSTPEEFYDRRVRTSPSEVNTMAYGVADWLGPTDHLATWDLVMPRFRNKDDECLFGLFDGRKHSKTGCRLTRFLNDNFTYHLITELEKTKDDDTFVSAIRRTFLALEKEFGSVDAPDKDLGASALMCYISGTKLHVANVGDALAVISRNNGQAYEITQKHIPFHPSEISRIRAAGGYVSNSGLLNDELHVSRSFGYYHLIPVVNANPYVCTITLSENDEFVIMASRGLWDRVSYQTAVDIARTEKDDMMVAAQKLRDFAITYGADDNIMVMIFSVGDLFEKKDKRLRNIRGMNLGTNRAVGVDGSTLLEDGSIGTPGMVGKNKRRIKDEVPGDSTLARLDREVSPPMNQVALVFTDIKSSTLLWELQPEDMRSAIKVHDAVMRRTLRSIGGYEVKTEGDAFMVCFQEITAALLWCMTVQMQLLEADWPAGILETEEGREIEKETKVIYRGLSVRMGIHWGTPVYERNPITKRMDYFGPVVNKASRICNAADGGQICISSDVFTSLRDMPGIFNDDNTSSAVTDSINSYSLSRDIQQLKRLGFHVVEMGERRLKGLETPEMLSLIFPKHLAGRIELEKKEISESSITKVENPSGHSSPYLRPPSSLSISDGSSRKDSSSTAADDSRRPSLKSLANRQIDPAFVVSLGSLAVRLERLTTGSIHMPSGNDDMYNKLGFPDAIVGVGGSQKSPFANAFTKRMEEVASDEELIMLIENFVTRIENAASSLFLQKVGKFTTVLEKLGEAIELDPMHVLRALQIYSEAEGLQ